MALSEEEAIIQISVDDSRNILYTLGDRGTITVWDIDNGGASKITSLSQASLVQNTVHVVKWVIFVLMLHVFNVQRVLI